MSTEPNRNDQTADGVLSLQALGKSYGAGDAVHEVLRDIDLSVEPGEFVCIVGPSGTGKTTLVRLVAGLLAPTAGAVVLSGARVTRPPETMAMVSQDYGRSLMPWMRVHDNVRLPLRGKGLSKDEVLERVTEALAAVGLASAANRYPWQLSGGMQQRVAIARALAYRPRVLLMDEPFASVDAETRAELEDLVRSLQRASGLTVLLVTHDVDEAVYLADRVVVIGGAPAGIMRTLQVPLDRDRDQLGTKSSSAFVTCRSDVLRAIQQARAALTDGRPGASV